MLISTKPRRSRAVYQPLVSLCFECSRNVTVPTVVQVQFALCLTHGGRSAAVERLRDQLLFTRPAVPAPYSEQSLYDYCRHNYPECSQRTYWTETPQAQ